MTTKGVEDGMGDTRTCGCTGEFGCFICDIRGQRPRATPAMKDDRKVARDKFMLEATERASKEFAAQWTRGVAMRDEVATDTCRTCLLPIHRAAGHETCAIDLAIWKHPNGKESCDGFGLWARAMPDLNPKPAMKNEVESATTAKFYARCGYCERKWLALTDKEECPVCLDVPFEQKGRPYFDRVNGYHPAPPSPTLKDEVYAPIFAYSPTRQHKDSCPCVEFAVGDEICSMLCEHCTCKESQPAAVTEPSPQTKDEVYAMLNGLHRAGQLNTETVRILWPYLEDAVKWRKR